MSVPSTRDHWIRMAERLSEPVLVSAAQGTLARDIPGETAPGCPPRPLTHLEAFARTLAGLAPWMGRGENASLRPAAWAREGLVRLAQSEFSDGVDPASEPQILVESAFLAQAILRGRAALWDPLDSDVRVGLIRFWKDSRAIRPYFNNWLLFSAMVETALAVLDEAGDWDRMRVDYALKQHQQWYLGDGTYSDGPSYHADYYNSFVIHPMMMDVTEWLPDRSLVAGWEDRVRGRARRLAALLERAVSPEGTYPLWGRSLAYRFGVFHGLAQSALRKDLPDGVRPAQVRCALTRVMDRILQQPGTFDERGWLRIGLCGTQPEIGESYISTGSLYLCTTALLPLGLGEDDPFWTEPDAPWTSVKAWSGQSFPIDHAEETS